MPEVLGIAASPRKDGNSEILLDTCLEGVNEAGISYEKIRICEMKISPCLNCGGCDKTGQCVVDDDMQALFKKFLDSPILIVSSPVFFMGLPAQLKAAVDRCQSIWVRKYVLKRRMPNLDVRRALFIQVGGMKKEKVFEGGLATISAFLATLDYEFREKLVFNDIDAKGAVSAHPAVLAKVRQAGLELGSSPEKTKQA